jgi:hypothetical protein
MSPIFVTREEIAEHYPEALLLEPEDFDSAIVGVAEQAGGLVVVIYNADQCIQTLMDMNAWDEEQALEFFTTNTAGAYMGPSTPMFLYDDLGE